MTGPDGGAPDLRVVLPLLNLVPGGMGGSETYVRHLVDSLEQRSDVAVTTIVSGAAAGELAAADEVVDRRVTGGESTRERLVSLAQSLRRPPGDARAALAGADVVHYPLTVPLPRTPGRRASAAPRVQTMLDVQHLDLPELFSRAELLYRRFAYDRPARQVDRVVTLSEFCRGRIVELLGVDRDRIDVVPLGVDTETFHPGTSAREDFVVYPARSWPHKNHERLVAAMERVREQKPDLRLVLTGGGADRLGPLPPWVEHRGLVPVAELAELYRRAAALVYPSRYEGFGLPPLEAMASDCPVAASAVGSLPEVCGDAAVLFDPTDVGAIAAAVLTAVGGGDRLVPLGHERLRRYTWAACAEAHLGSYRRAVEARAAGRGPGRSR